MCGIVGIYSKQPVAQSLYDALTILQHRGQDSAGIVTCDNNRLYTRKSSGLVREVFHTRHMIELKGNIGIGHVRYPTSGLFTDNEIQPLFVNSPYGITLAHNGNITNIEDLKDFIGNRYINSDSDSELILNVLAKLLEKYKLTDAVNEFHHIVKGAYAIVAIVNGTLIAFRDPEGIRPLIIGQRGEDYIIASESVALDMLDFKIIMDLGPGELFYISNIGVGICHTYNRHKPATPCIFEFVYLARPDSIIDGISVYKSRLRMGDTLGRRIHKKGKHIDVVIPVPDTSRVAATQIAHILDVKLREGFIKNRYIPRTFIMPGQELREKSVKLKLNAIDLEFKDKIVLIVDDSIVRGTTSKEIIKMARKAGAKKVYFASASPPVRYPNIYGINLPNQKELIAFGKTISEIQIEIGADWLIYQTLPALIEAVSFDNVTEFDISCFSGEYITAP